jgi:hypothetical protein
MRCWEKKPVSTDRLADCQACTREHTRSRTLKHMHALTWPYDPGTSVERQNIRSLAQAFA